MFWACKGVSFLVFRGAFMNDLVYLDGEGSYILGFLSEQCTFCRYHTLKGEYGCKIYKTAPEDYWLNEKKCPKFEDKRNKKE